MWAQCTLPLSQVRYRFESDLDLLLEECGNYHVDERIRHVARRESGPDLHEHYFHHYSLIIPHPTSLQK